MIRLFFKLIKLIIFVVVIVVGLNLYVIKTTEDKVVSAEMAVQWQEQPQCILVLGSSVNADGTPGRLLQDRLDTAIELYHRGAAPKLLLSGDNGQVVYNEVEVMKKYALEAGVAEEDIFLDHAGFSTYESVYRASDVFGVERMIVVTQKFHLYRALYGCNAMGIDAMGVGADREGYQGKEAREAREVLARAKDSVKWLIKPEPTFLGDAIPISGSGISTH